MFTFFFLRCTVYSTNLPEQRVNAQRHPEHRSGGASVERSLLDQQILLKAVSILHNWVHTHLTIYMWYFFKTFPALINSGTTQPLYIPCWVQRWYTIGSIQLDTVDHLLWIWKRLIWNYKFWSVYEPWGKGHKALRRLVSLMNELPTVHLTLKILNTCGIYNVDCSRLILHLQTQKDKYIKNKNKNKM